MNGKGSQWARDSGLASTFYVYGNFLRPPVFLILHHLVCLLLHVLLKDPAASIF